MTLNNVVMLGNLVRNYEGYWLKSKDIFTDKDRNVRSREITIFLKCDGITEDDFDLTLANGVDKILIQGQLCLKQSPKNSFHYLLVIKYTFVSCEKCEVTKKITRSERPISVMEKKLVNLTK